MNRVIMTACVAVALTAFAGLALADKEVSTKLVNATLEPMYMTPEEFAVRLNADYEKYGKLMKEIGVVK